MLRGARIIVREERDIARRRRTRRDWSVEWPKGGAAARIEERLNERKSLRRLRVDIHCVVVVREEQRAKATDVDLSAFLPKGSLLPSLCLRWQKLRNRIQILQPPSLRQPQPCEIFGRPLRTTDCSSSRVCGEPTGTRSGGSSRGYSRGRTRVLSYVESVGLSWPTGGDRRHAVSSCALGR